MKSAWVWVFAFLTAGGTAIAIVQTVTDPEREPRSLVYGIIIGALAVACIAALLTLRRRPPSSAVPRSQAQAIDDALVKVNDLKSRQAQAAAHEHTASAQAREARNSGVDVDAARFQGDATQYKAEYDGYFERIRTAENEVARLRRLSAKDWLKEQQHD